jgi:predicted acyltransferase
MKPTQRVDSLDVFRGVTIAAMILVNNPGSFEDAFAQLRHAAWHGWTLTDWIFPFFLWIVGVSMVFSFARRRERGESKRTLLRHVARRSLVLFMLGLLVNGFPFGLIGEASFSWQTFRLPGVLQRIALCYAFVGVLLIGHAGVWARVTIAAILLVGYWLAMVLIPVPGFGQGVLNPVGNLCWYIDSSLLGSHTWEYAPAAGFDPEGILSTFPAIATTLLGTLCGSRLRMERGSQGTTRWLLVLGLMLIVSGLLLSVAFPINKNLWSSSYVVFTAGCAFVCFGTLHWMVDIRGWKRSVQPFRIFGSNAITVFVISELLATLLWVIPGRPLRGQPLSLHDDLYLRYFYPLASPPGASLLFALAFLGGLYLLAWAMWRRKWFIKL